MTLFSIIKEIKPENITKIKDAVKSVPVVLDKITQAVKNSQPNYDVPTVAMVEQAKKAGDLEYAYKLDQARIGALPKTELKSYQASDVSDDHLIEMVEDNQRSQGDIRPSRQVPKLPSFSPENKLPLLKAYASLPEEKKKKIDANVIWKQGEELYKAFYREKYNLADTQVLNIPEEKREEVRQEWLKAPDLKKTQIYQKVMSQAKPVDEAKELMQRQERGMTLGFYKQLSTIYGEEKAKKIENQVVAAESQGRMVRGAVLNFVSGATLGVSDVVARSLMQDTPESLYGDDQKLTTYYTESKQIADALDSVKNVTDFAASMSGGLLSYGAISKRVSQILSKVPGPAGEWMAAHPVLTAYTVQGVGEEVVDMSIRKITGQQYGWSEFMMGMAMNTVFESVFRGAKKGMEAFSAYKENRDFVGKEIEDRLTAAEQAKGEKLTQAEVAKTVSQVPINDQFKVADLWKESRYAFLKGGKKGTPGIDYPAPLSEKAPAVANTGTEKAIDIPEVTTKEAIKYDTPEEFIRAQGEPVYHGTPEENIDKFRLPNEQDGIYFTKDKSYAESFKNKGQGRSGTVIEAYLDIKNPKIYDGEDPKIFDEYTNRQIDIRDLQRQGYDSAILKFNDGKDDLMVFSPSQIKTRSELTDIWNEAHGIKTSEDLPVVDEIPEPAKVMSDLEKEQLPWETDAEWKARIGESVVQEKAIVDFKEKELPELEGKRYLKYQAEDMIQKHIDEVMKPGMKRGVDQGGLSRDAVTGEVVGRTGRMSNNDKWYKDFYAKEGRAPKVSEMRQIAIDQMLEGYKGNHLETEPNQAFIDLKAQMDEIGVKMPLKKLSRAGMKEPVKKPVTVAKEELKKLANRKLTMAELGFQGEKGERLREIKQEVAKRLGIEKKIKAGEFEAIKAEDLLKVRKSGGVGQAVLKLIDKEAGKLTSEAVSLAGKVADKLTDLPKLKEFKGWAVSKLAKLTPQYGLDDDVYKALSDYRKAQNREFKGIAEVLESLKSVTKEDGAAEKAFQYLSGEKVEISDELKNVLDPIRDEIDIEGLRQVLIGNLPKETYFANMGRYMRRLYASHNLEGFSPLAESYNKLKNAFINKGLSEVDAEEAIVGIMGKNIKEKFKGVLPAGIKTGGGFQKARKLGNDELSLAIRDFLGEVQDPEYAIGRTLFDLKRSRLNYELLHELAGTGAVKDSVPAGYADEFKKLEGKEWGALDGKFMQKDVFEYLAEMKGQDGELGKMLTKINNFIKANLTVRNPAGQFRNFTSNFATSQAILGHNYLSVSGMKDLADAYKSLNTKDGFYQELVAYGRIGNTGITHDLGNRLEEVFKEAQSPGSDILSVAKKVDNLLGKSYEFGDNIFLMANYRRLRANGLEPIAAIREASRVTPDYGEVSPLIAKWRRSVVGLPFVTWRYKVYPEILKEMIKSPVKASMPIWFPWTVGNIVAAQLDLTDAEQEVFKTKLYRDGRLPIGRDKNGDVIYFDYGQYTPFADMFKGRYSEENTVIGMLPEQLEGYAEGAIPGIGSFPMQMMLDLANNYDPFTSRPITTADMWTPEWGMDIAMHVAPNLLPVVGLSVNNISKVAKGEMDAGEALLKSLTGIKREVSGVGRFEKEESFNTPGFSLDKEKSDIYKTVKDIAKLDPEKANEELNKLYDKYPDQESYISDRVRYEKDKMSGKSKAQSEIRSEVSSLFDISKKDKELANKRLEELYDKYPEYEEYITEKVEALKD